MRSILYIGNKLARHGATPTTIDALGLLLEEHFQVYYASEKKHKLWRFFNILWVLQRRVKQVDVVIIDTYGTANFFVAWIAALFARRNKKPYVPILHGGNLPLRLKNNPHLCRQIFKYAYQNVAPSAYMQTAFAKHNYTSQVIPNFIQITDYTFQQRSELQPKLLWVRSFASLYNPVLAIEVSAVLYTNYPNVQLCMVGPDKDGSLQQCKERAQVLGISDWVIFTGKLSKAEWHQLSTEYDIFINTTNVDNTPVSVIEAMALGLPVVSTNVGGLPYLLSDEQDALLVSPDDVSGMVAAIERLLHDPVLVHHITYNARRKVEVFDAEVVLEQWKTLLG